MAEPGWLVPASVPVPAALPPVPIEELLVPLPAEEPPVPSVEAEPLPLSLPEPAAEPPVPSEELLVPPPAELPPVPSVDAEPEPEPDPAAEPPVPSVVLAVPWPAVEPPVPTVELVCASAKPMLPARIVAANAAVRKELIFMYTSKAFVPPRRFNRSRAEPLLLRDDHSMSVSAQAVGHVPTGPLTGATSDLFNNEPPSVLVIC
jgi:hypothetical protein